MNMTSRSKARGFSLIEVMIAVVVLSFGLLALAALQGSLFRAGAESKARANATAVAQQVVENAKTFAFLTPPVDYTGNTYQSLDTAALGTHEVAGVTYTVRRDVRRFLSDGTGGFCLQASCPASVNVGYSGARPEFKELIVSVSWDGVNGAKSVQLTDSVSSISPADAAQVIRTPSGSSRGPEVWIVPPNKDNAQVVPIAIGGDQSAASSNPKPEQFVQDVSAATLFSVHTFTGDASGDEVKLNRKLDVAAVSCICEAGIAISTTTNPAYQPTVWNGKQLAYTEPQTLPVGTPIAAAVVANADSEVEPMCTVCCRDHHEAASRSPRADPWRLLTGTESSGGEHYGYKKNGGNFQVGEGLIAAGTDTAGLYVDACQLFRVGGQMRMAVDAQQNHLLVTPLNDDKTTYRPVDFTTRFSGLVLNSIKDGMASLPVGYPAPNARFPGPTAARLTEFADIVTPAAIELPPDTATNNTRKMVAFGLYIDYLSDDTKKAYDCALAGSNAGDCEGLGDRNPLEVLPLYAVNVANLGSWKVDTAKSDVASVVNATFKNGLLIEDGGTVTSQKSNSVEEFPITLKINKSNSGIAGTFPVDPDDASDQAHVTDAQAFTKVSGTAPATRNSVFVRVGATSTINLSTVTVTSPAGGTQCTFDKKTTTTTCSFDSPASLMTIGFANYTTSTRIKGVDTITNRKICVPADSRVSGPSVSGEGTVDETATLSVVNLAAVDYTLTVDIVDQLTACPADTVALKP